MEQKNGSATGGQTSEYIFTSHLGAATTGANNATLQYLFNTFASDVDITTGAFGPRPRQPLARMFSYWLPNGRHNREQLHLHGLASAAQVFPQHRLVDLEERHVTANALLRAVMEWELTLHWLARAQVGEAAVGDQDLSPVRELLAVGRHAAGGHDHVPLRRRHGRPGQHRRASAQFWRAVGRNPVARVDDSFGRGRQLVAAPHLRPLRRHSAVRPR